jgi:hypothetical protein
VKKQEKDILILAIAVTLMLWLAGVVKADETNR